LAGVNAEDMREVRRRTSSVEAIALVGDGEAQDPVVFKNWTKSGTCSITWDAMM
jgi:hypothetical protein